MVAWMHGAVGERLVDRRRGIVAELYERRKKEVPKIVRDKQNLSKTSGTWSDNKFVGPLVD